MLHDREDDPANGSQPKVAEHSHDCEQRQQVNTMPDGHGIGGFSLMRRFLLAPFHIRVNPAK
jgi:hypothetical protein